MLCKFSSIPLNYKHCLSQPTRAWTFELGACSPWGQGWSYFSCWEQRCQWWFGGTSARVFWSSGSDAAWLWTLRGAEEIARERQVGLDSEIVYGKPPVCTAIPVLIVKFCKYQWTQKLPENACGSVSFLVICFASVKSILFLFKSEAEIFVEMPNCEQCIQYLWVILLGPRVRSPWAKKEFCQVFSPYSESHYSLLREETQKKYLKEKRESLFFLSVVQIKALSVLSPQHKEEVVAGEAVVGTSNSPSFFSRFRCS